jgi:hypothetical protein
MGVVLTENACHCEVAYAQAHLRPHGELLYGAESVRITRKRLKAPNACLSPERALEYLRRIQPLKVRLNAGAEGQRRRQPAHDAAH